MAAVNKETRKYGLPCFAKGKTKAEIVQKPESMKVWLYKHHNKMAVHRQDYSFESDRMGPPGKYTHQNISKIDEDDIEKYAAGDKIQFDQRPASSGDVAPLVDTWLEYKIDDTMTVLDFKTPV